MSDRLPWPSDGWDVWTALMLDLLQDDPEQARDIMIGFLAWYMVDRGISVKNDQVHYKGRPYSECSRIQDLALPNVEV